MADADHQPFPGVPSRSRAAFSRSPPAPGLGRGRGRGRRSEVHGECRAGDAGAEQMPSPRAEPRRTCVHSAISLAPRHRWTLPCLFHRTPWTGETGVRDECHDPGPIDAATIGQKSALSTRSPSYPQLLSRSAEGRCRGNHVPFTINATYRFTLRSSSCPERCQQCTQRVSPGQARHTPQYSRTTHN